MALTFAESTPEQPNLYDCSFCLKHRPKEYRDRWGCRRENPNAKSKEKITLLENTESEISTDHCPGILVNSPFVASIYTLHNSSQLGYSLGNAKHTSFAEIESLSILRNVRNLIMEKLHKQ